MPIDISGNVLSNPTGDSLKIHPLVTINPASNNTMPNNPPAWSGVYSGYGGALSTAKLAVDTSLINNQVCWNGSQFTCPLTGIYLTSMSVIANGAASSTAGSILSNYGAPLKNGVLQPFWGTFTNDDWDTVNHVVLISCVVGDIITFAINTAPTQVGSGGGVYCAQHNAYIITFLG